MVFKLCIATAAVLLAISAGGVVAQSPDPARPEAPPAAVSHGASGAAMAPTSSASAALPGGASGNRSTRLSGDNSNRGSGHGPVYRSAFDGYRAFTDQPVLSWRESNDLVGRIGGWQAYAREGQGASATAPSPGAPATAAPNMPGIPAGHDGMAMPPPVSGTPAAPGHHSGPRKP